MPDPVARAKALLGVRFRPQGRSPLDGLDCVGVAAAVFALPARAVPADYPLRGGNPPDTEARIAGYFVRLAAAETRAGDLLLVETGPAQLHVVILTSDGFIHADAGLRRVVEVPGAVPWRVLSAWRHRETEGMAKLKGMD